MFETSGVPKGLNPFILSVCRTWLYAVLNIASCPGKTQLERKENFILRMPDCEEIYEPKAPTCVSSGVPRFAFHIKCLQNLALANIASC